MSSRGKSYKAVEAYLKQNQKFFSQYKAWRINVSAPDTSKNAMIWELINMAERGYATIDHKRQKSYEDYLERSERSHGLPSYALQDYANPARY